MNAPQPLARLTCEACGNQVMPALVRCPDCGTPLHKNQREHLVSHDASPTPVSQMHLPLDSANQSDSFHDMLSLAATVEAEAPIRQHVSTRYDAVSPRPAVAVAHSPSLLRPASPGPFSSAVPSVSSVGSSPSDDSRMAEFPQNESATDHSVGAAQTPKLLTVQCACGKKLKIRHEQLGKRIRCPDCQQAIQTEMALGLPANRSARNETPAAASTLQKSPAPVATPDANTAEEPQYSFLKAAKTLPPTPILAPRETPVEGESSSTTRKAPSRGQIKKYLATLEIQDPGSQEESVERRQAVLNLGETGDAEFLDALLKVLDDPWVTVREALATALGKLQDPQATVTLVTLLGDSAPEVCRAAVTALGKIGDGRAIDALVHLTQIQPHRKAQVAEAIVGMRSAAVPGLCRLLQHPDPALNLEAITLLGQIQQRDATEPLLKFLMHTSPTLRAHTAESLGKIGDPRAVVPLCEAAVDGNLGVRLNAITALAKLADRRCEKILLNALKDADDDIRLQAIIGLGQIGDNRYLSTLIPLLADDDDRIRGALAHALGNLIDPRCIEPLLHLLQDAHENVRLKAVTSLKKYHDPRIVPFLVDCLDDRNEIIQLRAVDALGEHKASIAVSPLVSKLVVNRSSTVRAAAAKALGDIGDPIAIDKLLDALNDEYGVRFKAIVALGQFANPKVLSSLLSLLKDPIPEIRYHVATALSKQENQHAKKGIEQLLNDNSPMVRRCAAKILADQGDLHAAELLKDDKILRNKPRQSVKSVFQNFNPTRWIDQFRHSTPLRKSIVLGVPIVAVLGILIFMGIIPLGSSDGGSVPLANRGNILGLAISPDGQQVAMTRSAGLVEIWERAGKTPLQQFKASSQGIRFTMNPQHSLLFTGGELQLLKRDAPEAPPSNIAKLNTPIRYLETTPDAKFAVTWTQDGSIRIWNLAANREVHNLNVPPQETTAVALSPDAKFIVSGLQSGAVVIWDVQTGQMINRYPDLKGPVTALAISRNGQYLAAGTQGGQYFVWDLTTATLLANWFDFSEVRYLAINSQQSVVLAASDLTTIKRWNWNDKTSITFPATDAEQYNSFAISGDEKTLAVGGSQDSEVWLFDVEQGTLSATLDIER
ncbi:MAG: HEAT repeat domain-containing protein [Planctomycetaceae bacterium]